jgi:lipid II:glycine glycyltransferase (peptidoglycan interpeptide bridge formation enzyme)
MNYKLQEIQDKETWNQWIISLDLEFYSFLQSWEWWEVQVSLWKKVLRLGIFDSAKCIWYILCIQVNAKRGKYILIPHGPLISKDYVPHEVFSWIQDNLRKTAEKYASYFIRINSCFKNTLENKNKFKKLWFRDAPMHENVEDTHLLDIRLSEEDLLKNMKKGDRYYINRAIKEWVEIKISNSEEQIATLIEMHKDHSKWSDWKHKYTAFSEDFIRSLYDKFWNNITTISASYDWNVESILMTIKFGKTCVYYVAASDIKNPKFSPNYLCQWEAIKSAKARWAEMYNFWGVSPDNNPKHPIAGVSKFKRKFAWYDYSLLHAQDLALTPRYWINYLIETVRRKKRGYYYKKAE